MRIASAVMLIFVTASLNATVLRGNEFLVNYEKRNDMAIVNFLNGYMAGQWDSLEVTNERLADCVGTDVRMSQLVDVVAIYLKANPEIRHQHPSKFISAAIAEKFNCPNN